MKRVLLRAPLLTNSGYGVHSRQIFEWLSKKNNIDLTVECLNWGMTSWILDKESHDGLISKIMNCSKKVEGLYDITFQVQLPDEWNPSLGKKNIGITAGVETTICSPKWIENCNKMDKIVVPSGFTKNVIKQSGILTTEVIVIPEFFNHSLLNKEKNKNICCDFRTKFNFLMISQLTGQTSETDRKNIFNTIKWFCEYFKDNKDVGLVIKTNSGKNTKIDKSFTEKSLKNLLQKVRKSEFPKVYLIHGDMSKSEIADLYYQESIKCFVSATRGEGYGLPIVDAAAAGMPVVATNWSGHLGFLKNMFLKVDYELVDLPENKIDNRIFFKGAKWANPLQKSFKEKLSEAYNNIEKYKQQSEILKKETIDTLHKEKIFLMYDKIIDI